MPLKLKRLGNIKTNHFSKRELLVFLLIFALIGGYILIHSLAAPNPNLPGDLNNDNTVNVTDLSILLSNYGSTSSQALSTADINADGAVNVLDLSILLSHYGGTYSGQPQPIGISGTWTLKFDDEFNGTSLDLSKWSNCWFSPSCGTMNNVSTSPTNVQVSNGNLILTLASSSSGALVSTNPYGGAITGYQFQYGVAEARIWFPGDGTHCYNWPAWWTDGQTWPTNGENDIAEVGSGSMTVNYHSASGAHNQGAIPGYWCGGYHTYAINRQANRADVYYDGILVKSYATDDAGALQYLIINVGYNSSYPAYGTSSQVKVDYVRAWQ